MIKGTGQPSACVRLSASPSLTLVTNSSSTVQYNENPNITNLKTNIMSLYIIPTISKKWQVVTQNLPFLDGIYNQIDNLTRVYSDTSLVIYTNILRVLEQMVQLQVRLVNLEQHESEEYGEYRQVSHLSYDTVLMRLRPEYELYNLIIGRPDFSKKETYRTEIISDIVILLNNEYTSYDFIKTSILSKYQL